MLAFARQCLRQHAFNRLTSTTANPSLGGHTRDPSAASTTTHTRNASVISNVAMEINPFSTRFPEGQGWKGRLGRLMVAVGRAYWLDGDVNDDDDSWTVGMHRKFHKVRGGVGERERRRRAGTGPPLPSKDVLNSVALQSAAPAPSPSPYPLQGVTIGGGQPLKGPDAPDSREREI
jgi:hypothetical protein